MRTDSLRQPAAGSSKLVTGSLRQYPCGAFVKLELRHCQLTTLVFSQPAPAAAAPPQASTAAAATGLDAAGATTAAEALATMSAAGPADAGSVATLEAVVGDGGGRIAPTTAAASSGPALGLAFVCRTCAKGFPTAAALGGHHSKLCGQLKHRCGKCRCEICTQARTTSAPV